MRTILVYNKYINRFLKEIEYDGPEKNHNQYEYILFVLSGKYYKHYAGDGWCPSFEDQPNQLNDGICEGCFRKCKYVDYNKLLRKDKIKNII